VGIEEATVVITCDGCGDHIHDQLVYCEKCRHAEPTDDAVRYRDGLKQLIREVAKYIRVEIPDFSPSARDAIENPVLLGLFDALEKAEAQIGESRDA
jgi:hypothetical protein